MFYRKNYIWLEITCEESRDYEEQWQRNNFHETGLQFVCKDCVQIQQKFSSCFGINTKSALSLL